VFKGHGTQRIIKKISLNDDRNFGKYFDFNLLRFHKYKVHATPAAGSKNSNLLAKHGQLHLHNAFVHMPSRCKGNVYSPALMTT
jgi:hypothetical protein